MWRYILAKIPFKWGTAMTKKTPWNSCNKASCFTPHFRIAQQHPWMDAKCSTTQSTIQNLPLPTDFVDFINQSEYHFPFQTIPYACQWLSTLCNEMQEHDWASNRLNPETGEKSLGCVSIPFYCFLKGIWILKSSRILRSPNRALSFHPFTHSLITFVCTGTHFQLFSQLSPVGYIIHENNLHFTPVSSVTDWLRSLQPPSSTQVGWLA